MNRSQRRGLFMKTGRNQRSGAEKITVMVTGGGGGLHIEG